MNTLFILAGFGALTGMSIAYVIALSTDCTKARRRAVFSMVPLGAALILVTLNLPPLP